jgi:hypothetical protein
MILGKHNCVLYNHVSKKVLEILKSVLRTKN